MSELREFLAPVTGWTLAYKPYNPTLDTCYILMAGGDVILASGDQCLHVKLPEWLPEKRRWMHIGHLNRCNVQAIETIDDLPKNSKTVSLKQALAAVDKQQAAMLSCAAALLSWDARYQYCFSCGERLSMAEDERAKVCHACDTRCYPHVSPCVIMAVRRGRKLLLARHTRFKAGRYSVLAGFIESGESAEEAVHREVLEETGITVKNIEYVGSQPWPFPSQLMLGFLCDYDKGELKLDSNDLEDGGWFDIDSLPNISPSISISYYLIKEMVRRIKDSE